MTSEQNGALVLFSGGQDSATCLAWALARYERVETVGFAYGQRHDVEMQCRETVRAELAGLRVDWAGRLGPDHVIDLPALGEISDTALTQERAIEIAGNGLPNTFVPGRNLLFFTFAAALGYRRGLRRLVGGMCESDYSGYPDCREDSLKSLEATLNLGMDARFVLETPLMHLTKGESWALARELGGEALVEIIRADTHSCYLGNREQSHAWGKGCGTCPACELRARGWLDFAAGDFRAAAGQGSARGREGAKHCG